MRHRRALALLVVVGILGILVVLGMAFAMMARLERRASQQRLHATQALLLARSGLEDAMARLSAGQDPSRPENAYAGEDWDVSRVLDGVEVPAEVLRRGTLDVEGCPAGQALRPSFFVRATSSPLRPLLEPVDGRPRGVSGRWKEGEGYALRVLSSEGLFVNGGDPTAPSSMGYNATLFRIFGTLGEALDRADGINNALPADVRDGQALIDRRPAMGWSGLEEIASTLGWSTVTAEAFRPYLTFQAWTDKRVIVPDARDPSLPTAVSEVHGWRESVLLGHRTASDGSRRPDFERMQGRLVGRAPVSLAWAARHKPALIALVSGLSGIWLDELGSSEIRYGDFIGTLRKVEILNAWSSADNCHRAADRIAATWASGDPTWQEFDASCDGISFAGANNTEVQALRDLLKANFNPNSDLNKFNPDRSMWRMVDKSDLLAYSTEFSLGPPFQGFEVESAGRVLDPAGRVLAQRVLGASLSPLGILRISTQSEFACEDLGDLDIPGDERRSRLPGNARFLSEGRTAARTWGHALDLRAAEPSSYLNGTSSGVSLQSYPEPCFDAGGGMAIRPADYDGRLALATVETPKDAAYSQTSPAVPAVEDMKLLARFTKDLDLDEADGGGTTEGCIPDVSLASGAELAHGLLHGSKPATLHPDGAYSERGRAPGWLDAGNADGYHGVMSFWVKNNFSLMTRHAPRSDYGRARRYVYWSNLSDAASSYGPNQLFFVGMANEGGSGTIWTLLKYEIGHHDVDSEEEHDYYTTSASTFPHRWRLLSLFWDSRSRSADAAGEIVTDDGGSAPGGAVCSPNLYGDGRGQNPLHADDLTAPDYAGGLAAGVMPHR